MALRVFYAETAFRFLFSIYKKIELLTKKKKYIYSEISDDLFHKIWEKERISVANIRNKKNVTANEDILKVLLGMKRQLNRLDVSVKLLAPQVAKYDFDLPGNGFRTYLKIVDNIANQIYHALDGNRTTLYKELEEWLVSLNIMLEECLNHMDRCLPAQLFPEEESTIEEIIEKYKRFNASIFYGTFFGIQYEESLVPFLRGVSLLMANCFETYYKNAKFFGLFNFFKKNKSQRMAELAYTADVGFIQYFWKLSELSLVNFYTKLKVSIDVSLAIEIRPVVLNLVNEEGYPVEIPVPSAHVGPKTIRGLLISSKKRIGMMPKASHPPSRFLLIHVHGGGFVSQSAKSQECFTRSWAIELDVPIFSIDYSLAPEAPFPRALEDVLYCYCWALNNASLLGSTAERIIMTGDSAGANLILGVAQACIDLNIRRPFGLALAYVPVLVSYVVSPSRSLGIMDSLLPIGFMLRCMEAYAGNIVLNESTQDNGEISNDQYLKSDMPMFKNKYRKFVKPDKKQSLKCDKDECKGNSTCTHRSLTTDNFQFTVPHDRYLSPYLAPDSVLLDLPSMSILTSNVDPCLDDAIMFAKRLRQLDVKVTVDIVDGLPHGFLNFALINEKAREGSEICLRRIEQLMDKESLV